MPAICVERGVADLEFRALPAAVDPLGLSVVRNDKGTSSVARRQADHEGGEDPGRLFRIPMRSEEAAALINEQLVELRLHLAADPQFGSHRGNDAIQKGLPRRIVEGELFRLELPNAAHSRIDDRLFAAAVRRLRGLPDDFPGVRC